MNAPLIRADNVSRSFRGRAAWFARSEIKAVREVTSLGLKEAKDLVDGNVAIGNRDRHLDQQLSGDALALRNRRG